MNDQMHKALMWQQGQTNGQFNSTRRSLRLCGKVPHGDHILTYRKADGSSVVLSGLMRCESASACVVCSARIAKGRGEWLSKVFENAKARGETIGMLTLTVRHKKKDDLRSLLEAMENSYRNLQGTQAFKDLRGKYNAKFVRVTEVTWGKNGWHPHFHIAIISDPVDNWSHYKIELRDTWSRWIVNNGLEAPDPEIAVDIVENATNEQRAWYLTKSNGLSSLEVTNGKYKVAKGDNMSIWGVHSLAVGGDLQALKIWQEYEQGIYKKRIFVISRGMSEEYGVYMKSESELAADEVNDDNESPIIYISDQEEIRAVADNQLIFVGAINKETWRRIKKAKLENQFRESIRTNTLDDFLEENHFQTSYKYDDIRIRHELQADLLASMHRAMDHYDPKAFDEANQAYNLGELFPRLDQTLANSF